MPVCALHHGKSALKPAPDKELLQEAFRS